MQVASQISAKALQMLIANQAALLKLEAISAIEPLLPTTPK